MSAFPLQLDTWNLARITYRKEKDMPNGGYPIHLLLTPAQRPDLCLHVAGLTISLAEWTTSHPRRHLARPPLATFTRAQSEALLHHLAYRGLGETALPLLNQRRAQLGVRGNGRGVEYDY